MPPAAIGWEQIRRLEAPLLEMIEAWHLAGRRSRPHRAAARRGRWRSFLFGALCEMAMIVAGADDQKAAHRQAVGEIGRVLDGLRFD